MVDTFLRANEPDDPDESEFAADYGRPSWAEVGSVVALAVRLRLGGVGAAPSSFARGEVVRRVALAGLLVHAASALAGLLSLVWFPDSRLPVGALTWVGAYLALVLGQRRAALAFAAVGLLLTAVTVGHTTVIGAYSVEGALARLVVDAVPVLAMAAFHRDAPPVPVRRWLVALPVAGVAASAALLVPVPPVLGWSGLLCVALVVAGVVHLIRGGRGPWSGALLVLAAALLLERLVSVLHYMRFEQPHLVMAGLLEAAAVALLAAALAVRAVRAVA